eukprot:TRINITY_DN14068_c0_g1_i1.p1 TRINITY_DN14068_c0_g1~~TRINITY_DN14068_c0_g1_i1.p1  ORF type:complete len:512 (-),score=136.97 TRINITY_DN14068_c0_g1_i1:56-1591(-)
MNNNLIIKEDPPFKYSPTDLWEPQKYFQNKVINSLPHTLVKFFFNLTLDIDRILDRYTHIYPGINKMALRNLLTTQPSHFYYGGCDLFYVTEAKKKGRKMIVLEATSNPSGQKSMPNLKENDDRGGYISMVKRTIKPWYDYCLKKGRLIKDGIFVVLYDKDGVEARGYALTIAQVLKEEVYIVELPDKGGEENKYARYSKDNRYVLQVRLTENGPWQNVKACMKILKSRPWNRIPLTNKEDEGLPKTQFLNPLVVDLSGGKDKNLAAKSFEFFNAKYKNQGFVIRSPETINDVQKPAIPLWIEKFGGQAVVKTPHSSAGQGIYTIANQTELKRFMESDITSDEFLVQQLVGSHHWKTYDNAQTKYYHVGTIPTKENKIYVADLRFIISYDFKLGCFRPIAIYARRAQEPLTKTIPENSDSWSMLGTSLSVKKESGEWEKENHRLLMGDQKDFNSLGISVDDLIDGFLQSVMSMVAIDELAYKIQKGTNSHFDVELFSSLNKNKKFLNEFKK